MIKEKTNESATLTNMNENIEALLAYLFGWISGLVILLLEKKSRFAKFHAAQSVVVFGGLAVLEIIVAIIAVPLAFVGLGILVTLLSAIIYIAALVLWILLMVKAYQHEEYRVPFAADIADKLVKSTKQIK